MIVRGNGDQMSNWNILVVEDDPDGQELVALVLRHHHMNVDVVRTAEEALWSLSSGKKYAAAILDLSLPGMDGWSLLERIQGNPATAHVACVAVTAYHTPEMDAKTAEAGFSAYFPKPIEVNSFARELQSVLRE